MASTQRHNCPTMGSVSLGDLLVVSFHFSISSWSSICVRSPNFQEPTCSTLGAHRSGVETSRIGVAVLDYDSFMKKTSVFALITFSCLSIVALAATQTVGASYDPGSDGDHQGTVPVAARATIKCLTASAPNANPNLPVVCSIYGPGISGIDLRPGQTAGTSGQPGTVILRCGGSGYPRRCSASLTE
jgi:hypothetical protein